MADQSTKLVEPGGKEGREDIDLPKTVVIDPDACFLAPDNSLALLEQGLSRRGASFTIPSAAFEIDAWSFSADLPSGSCGERLMDVGADILEIPGVVIGAGRRQLEIPRGELSVPDASSEENGCADEGTSIP